MRKCGIILVAIGLILLIFQFNYKKSLDNINEENVNTYIEETSVIEEQTIENNKEETKTDYKEKNEITYTAILEIPKINLKRGVVDSTKNFKSINYAISVDNSSHYPDENGNFILYSHSGNSSIAFFNRLNKLDLGDDIYIYYKGIKHQYEIKNKYNIEKTGKAEVISGNKNKYITLITCNPNQKGYQIVIEGIIVDEINY